MTPQIDQFLFISMPRIRPALVADAANIARVHVDTWRTSYVGIVPDEHLAHLSYERCQAGWIEHLSNPQGEITYVGESSAGQIVAITSGGPLRESLPGIDGELYGLYVLKAYQRAGYGRLLVAQIARSLADNGFHSMVIWVLKDNSACRFYEKLGGRLIGEKTVEIGGKQLIDVAYAWNELSIFDKRLFEHTFKAV